ncbi:hypothetical protein RHMOL_Rhmol02G0074800 [Rhododendron molle]|uniref:Uncharacterized protein n=1 Tax=Rhododendron molle TaxID=49168 RepID=A0ACC0PMA2_RHOML|nr:hypothetical protein RHMOL_Rhmol02G0074800 [Rhododendron molle]
MQGKLEEAHAAILRENEEAKIAIEQAPPVIKEVPVVDNSKVEELTIQNEDLEGAITELKKRVEEFEQKYSEVENESKARLKQAEDSQLKVSELQEAIERLELNLSNLESENQVLRQQALVASTNEDLSEEMKSLKSKITDLESENELLRTQKVVGGQIISHAPVQLQSKESEPFVPLLTKQRSLTDRQQENHDALIKCLVEDKRFDKSRPVAACIVLGVGNPSRRLPSQSTSRLSITLPRQPTLRISRLDSESIDSESAIQAVVDRLGVGNPSCRLPSQSVDRAESVDIHVQQFQAVDYPHNLSTELNLSISTSNNSKPSITLTINFEAVAVEEEESHGLRSN